MWGGRNEVVWIRRLSPRHTHLRSPPLLPPSPASLPPSLPPSSPLYHLDSVITPESLECQLLFNVMDVDPVSGEVRREGGREGGREGEETGGYDDGCQVIF